MLRAEPEYQQYVWSKECVHGEDSKGNGEDIGVHHDIGEVEAHPSAIPATLVTCQTEAVLGFDRLIQLEGLEEASHELAEIPQPLLIVLIAPVQGINLGVLPISWFHLSGGLRHNSDPEPSHIRQSVGALVVDEVPGHQWEGSDAQGIRGHTVLQQRPAIGPALQKRVALHGTPAVAGPPSTGLVAREGLRLNMTANLVDEIAGSFSISSDKFRERAAGLKLSAQGHVQLCELPPTAWHQAPGQHGQERFYEALAILQVLQPSRLIHATLEHGDERGEQHFGQARAFVAMKDREADGHGMHMPPWEVLQCPIQVVQLALRWHFAAEGPGIAS
mmetsp:Transcript_130182/g.308877  ORF Transcript_130182/g.308877 Transcript_130182/m.308877 type:complete len:332 (-) Transcript_130182:441-1436(-)